MSKLKLPYKGGILKLKMKRGSVGPCLSALSFHAKGESLMEERTLYDVVIIGSGPGGMTAALYTSRANLKH